jgi:hypothetical protein
MDLLWVTRSIDCDNSGWIWTWSRQKNLKFQNNTRLSRGQLISRRRCRLLVRLRSVITSSISGVGSGPIISCNFQGTYFLHFLKRSRALSLSPFCLACLSFLLLSHFPLPFDVPVDVLHFLASLFRACLPLLLLSLTLSCLSRFDVVVCRLVGVLGDVLHFLAFLSLVLGVLVGGLVAGLVGGIPGGLVGE